MYDFFIQLGEVFLQLLNISITASWLVLAIIIAKREKIIIDPGIGFAKDTKQNLILLNNLGKLVDMGYPVLLGTSNKSVIGNTLNLDVDNRLEGTIATSVLGLNQGCSFFRVHNVEANKRALMMTNAIINSN